MNSTLTKKNHFKPQQREYVVKKIAKLREEAEDLMDYLDLLEARARNQGKPHYTTEQVKQALGIK